eukprot:gene3726-2624_t
MSNENCKNSEKRKKKRFLHRVVKPINNYKSSRREKETTIPKRMTTASSSCNKSGVSTSTKHSSPSLSSSIKNLHFFRFVFRPFQISLVKGK